jgi:hypothetical protein
MLSWFHNLLPNFFNLYRYRAALAAIKVGRCTLNSFDPYPITYSLSNS